jgi:hypothetical protein
VSELSIIDKNDGDIQKLDTSIFFYSSVYNVDLDDFKNKNFLWCSDKFDQALLHLFDLTLFLKIGDRKIVQPKIYKFKFKKNVNILTSYVSDNKSIFKYIFGDLITELLEILKTYSIINFKGEKNKYILLILQELNKFLEEDNRIYGYYNYYDQKETAVINFSELVDSTTIKKSDYKKIVINTNNDTYWGECDYSNKTIYKELLFPSKLEDLTEDFFITKYYDNLDMVIDADALGQKFPADDFFSFDRGTTFMFNGKKVSIEDYSRRDQAIYNKPDYIYRMILNNKCHYIIYTDFDTGEEVKWVPLEIKDYLKKYLKYGLNQYPNPSLDTYKSKYLKYKQKYLKLKKKLNL